MRKTKELFIVRHGDSSKKDAHGKPLHDKTRGLSEVGRQEVQMLSRHLKMQDIQPNLLVASYFTRALQTAEILAHGLHIQTILKSELIGEADLGTLPNTKSAMLEAEYGYNSDIVTDHGGESIDLVEKRVKEFLLDLQGMDFSSGIVVSHGLVLSVMSQLLQNIDRTFANIQALQTADYSYFLLDEEFLMLEAHLNVLKGSLSTR